MARIKTRYILGSGSPRRKELIQKIGVSFEVITSDAEEIITKEEPSEIVKELSQIKAQAVLDMLLKDAEAAFLSNDRLVIVGADTIVAYNGDVLGKPIDEEDGRSMIGMLSDRTHQVYTGVSIIIVDKDKYLEGKKVVQFAEKTDVTFYPLDKYDIEEYIESGDYKDKAGAYGIQGDFAKHIKGIDGDYYNVVGLPVGHLYQVLKDERLI